MQQAVAGRASDLYLHVFRPLAPACCAVAFVAAWLLTGSDAFMRVAIGLGISVILALVYLGATRLVPTRIVLASSLFLDELLIAGLVAQVSDPEALSVAFLWSVALGGLFVSLRVLAAITALATALAVVVPLFASEGVREELLAANVVIFVVIAAAMTFARRQERQTAIALGGSRRQLEEAQRLAHVGSFLWYPRTQQLEWSAEMYRIWGAEPGEMKPSYEYLDQVDPAERDQVKATVAAAVEGRTSYDQDLRLVQEDGSIRVVRAQGDWAEGSNGEPCMVGTVQDVTHLRHVEELQREFVATASHELRTPAAIVGGFADTLERQWDELDDAGRREMLGHIRAGADRLGRLVEDVLQVSRIESQQVILHPVDVRLDQLLRDAVSDARDDRVVLTSTPDTTVFADPGRLRQITDNLLQNALRHANRVVQVEVKIVGTHVRVEVQDDGAGIPPSDRERVFERFVRLSEPSKSGTAGTGLGLYIARQLVELGGGTIGVCDSPFGGACFCFTMPRHRP